MRFRYDNKIYNTAKSEKVLEYITGKTEVAVYVTSGGDWFYVCTERGYQDARALEAKYVKNIMTNRNRQDLIDKYNKHFGDC